MAQVFPASIKERSEYLVLDTLHKGHSFGEVTALNREASPYTIEVSTEKAILLKVHINSFMWHFGGEEGEPVMAVRSKIVMKTNWLRMKKQFLAYMSKEKLLQLEYRDDERYNQLEPKRTPMKEVPFMQNNPKMPPKVTATSIVESCTQDDLKRKERHEKIEQLKR